MKCKHKSIRNSLLEILCIWQFGSGVDFEDIKNVTVRFLHSTLLVLSGRARAFLLKDHMFDPPPDIFLPEWLLIKYE